MGFLRWQAGVVQEDRKDLVVGDGVKGQDGVAEEVEARLGSENLLNGDWLLFDRGSWLGGRHGRLRNEGG